MNDTLKRDGLTLSAALATPVDQVGSFVRDEPIVPGYELLGVLGRGGMGVVYKARQVSLNRVVALKMIRAGTDAGPVELGRFRREAEAAARLQHPNVVQIYEVGEWQGREGDPPQPYIALEYVSGGSLADSFRRSLQPPQATAQFIETVARALAYVHDQGIIHRDLKPGNILLLGPGVADGAWSDTSHDSPLATHEPKITDFGLAKVGLAGQLTQTGVTLGTPSYMAPEQIDSGGLLAGPATDIYGLGAILYEALTGRPPFKAETPLATLLQVRHVEPVPPRVLQPTVPRDLETICLKCLSKDPGRRYASAAHLADDLRRFQAGEPIHARPAGVVERLGRWCRRKPAVAGLLAALVLAVVGGFAGITALWLVADRNWHLAVSSQHDAEHHLQEAQQQRARAEENFRLAQKAVDDFALKVSRDGRLRSNHRPLRQELLTTAVQFYEQFVAASGDDPRLRAELGDAFRRLGEIVRETDDPAKALTCFLQARDLFTELNRNDPDNAVYLAGLAGCEYSLTVLYQETGNDAEWEQAGARAIGLFKRLKDRFPNNVQYTLDLARSHAHLGYFYERGGRLGPAETEQTDALHLLQRLRTDHPTHIGVATSLAKTHNFFGLLYSSQRKRTEAAHEYRSALAIQRELMNRFPDDDDYQGHVAAAGNNLGLIHRQERRYADAEREFLAAAAINRGLIARLPEVAIYHRFLAANLTNLGHTYRESQRPEAAVAHYEEANSIYQRLIDKQPNVPDYVSERANNISNLGHILKAAGKAEESLLKFDEAIGILERLHQQSGARTFIAASLRNAHWRRADALDLLDRHAEAVQAWDRAAASDDGSNRDRLRLFRARSVARGGDYRSALTAVEPLAAAKTGDGDVLFELGRIYAIAAGAVSTDPALPTAEREESARRFVERAVAFVRAAKDKGLQNADRVNDVKEHKEFAPLRQHAEFQALLKALEAAKEPSQK